MGKKEDEQQHFLGEKERLSKFGEQQKKGTQSAKGPASSPTNDSLDESELTPWQRENMKYLKISGAERTWSTHAERKEIEKKLGEKKSKVGVPQANGKPLQIPELDAEQMKSSAEEEPSKELPRKKSFADRLPKIKTERQRRLVRRLSVLIGTMLFFILVIIYFISPLSVLKSVTIEGNHLLTQEELVKTSKLQLNKGFWSQAAERSKAENRLLKTYPELESVKIKLSGLNRLTIAAQEYTEVALLKNDSQWRPVLETGYVVKDQVAKTDTSDLLKIENMSSGTALNKLLKSYPKFSDAVKKQISTVVGTPVASNKYLVTINMKDGNQVIASTFDVADKINRYPKIAASLKEKSVVDMEAGIYSYPMTMKAQESEIESGKTTSSSTDTASSGTQ